MYNELLKKYLHELEADKFLAEIKDPQIRRTDYLKTPEGRSVLTRLIFEDNSLDDESKNPRVKRELSELESIVEDCKNIGCIYEAINNLVEIRKVMNPENQNYEVVQNTIKRSAYRAYELSSGDGKILISLCKKTSLPLGEILDYITLQRKTKIANA